MTLLHDPFSVDFMQRALLGGSLVAIVCGVVGTWVVVRGMAFLGEAIGHGMLPGVAVATLVGAPVVLGGAASAAVMSVAVGTVHRRGRLSYDTAIGLLFVAMLSLGVIIVSYSGSFATDATAMLFGDILALTGADVAMLAVALVVTLALATAFHRAFVATAFDPRVAQTLGLRPALAQGVLVGLVTLAVVASYQAVGSLLVIGLLLAPAVAAFEWTTRIPTTMALASVLGVLSVLTGLLVSWHAGTAAGSSVAYTAVLVAAGSAALSRGRRLVRRPHTPPVAPATPDHQNGSHDPPDPHPGLPAGSSPAHHVVLDVHRLRHRHPCRDLREDRESREVRDARGHR